MNVALPSDRVLADLDSSANLRELLAAATCGARERRIAVALRCGQHTALAGVTDDDEDSANDWAAPLGCTAKLLAATLARTAAAEGQLDLDSNASEVLACGAAHLRGVTLRHLLEHTHGLDDSMLAAPRHRQGFIDRAELVTRVGRLDRWSEPGAHYSYGNLGAWLVAASLERVYGRPYGLLVRDRVLGPIGLHGAFSSDRPLCAATGGGLALTAGELVRFVSQAFPPHAIARPTDMDSACAITRLPGWNPLERGIYLGWKYAGDGWFGHQSTWPRASVYVRVHPWRNVALAVLSRGQAAAVVAVRVFGSHFPELFDLKSPTGPVATAARVDPERMGRYAQAAYVVDITSHGLALQATGYRRDAHGVLCHDTRALLRGAAGVWFAQPATEAVPYVQFLWSNTAGALLWNGRCVLHRPTES